MEKLYENYEKVAEFFPIVIQKFFEVEEMFRNEFATLKNCSYPILDIGAGTGRIVKAMSEIMPDVEIIAVEPCRVMRAVLTQEVVKDERLKRQVTILSDSIEEIEFPEKIGGVVAYGVLGHLDSDDRHKLWNKILPKMEKGSPIFVELLPNHKPVKMGPISFFKDQIGKCIYELTFTGEPAGENLMKMTSCWSITDWNKIIKMVESSNYWYTFGFDVLADEIGLTPKILTKESAVFYV